MSVVRSIGIEVVVLGETVDWFKSVHCTIAPDRPITAVQYFTELHTRYMTCIILFHETVKGCKIQQRTKCLIVASVD